MIFFFFVFVFCLFLKSTIKVLLRLTKLIIDHVSKKSNMMCGIIFHQQTQIMSHSFSQCTFSSTKFLSGDRCLTALVLKPITEYATSVLYCIFPGM